jgi:hypothetical protein
MWDEKGQLLDLQPYVDEDYTQEMQEDFHPGLWDGMYNPATGARFAIPYYYNLEIMWQQSITRMKHVKHHFLSGGREN